MAAKVMTGAAPALITPFDSEGNVAVDEVPKLVEHYVSAGVGGLYLCGSTGSGIAMTVEERKTMTAAVCNAVAGRVPVLVMVGACPVDDAIALAKHAKEVGAAAVSSTVPGAYAWMRGEEYKPDLGAAIDYFTKVASATDLPFWPYWLGGSLAASAQEFLEAMSTVPNFKGMKYTTTDMFTFQQIRFMALKQGKSLNLVTGCDEMFVCGCVMKSDGGIGSTYNVMPKLYSQLHTAFHSGDIAGAMEIQEKVNQVVALLIDTCHCRERGTNIVAGIMAVLRSRGFNVGFPREAVLSRPFSAEDEKALLDGIKAMDFVVE